MRKKLDTRFPAARIKKIMQADEEVGKIAMATPVLISKALELFLQDLCDRTYQITLKRGAKTMNSHHLKECVRNHSVFDFLRELVARVPDLDLESGGESSSRRRKAAEVDDESAGEEAKRARPDVQVASSSRGCGRGRGRGRKSSTDKKIELERNDSCAVTSPPLSDECEFPKSPAINTNDYEGDRSGTSREVFDDKTYLKAFDLNMELDENGEVPTSSKDDDPNSQQLEARIQTLPGGIYSSQAWPGKGILDQEEDYDFED